MVQRRSVVLFAVGFLLTASPVLAETIRPDEAPWHLGQVVTVEGVVSDVHHAASGRATFIDIGGRYPNNSPPLSSQTTRISFRMSTR
jgi:hypothetical protein